VERDGTGHVTTALPWYQEGSYQITRAFAFPAAPSRVIQVRNSTLPALSSSFPLRGCLGPAARHEAL
jgi:hypothetical protein